MHQTRAVLTGDLIQSRRAAPAVIDAAMRTLAAAAQDIGRWQDRDPRFTRFRGDGWQILLQDPELSLEALLFLIARLKAARSGLSTRVAIGFGTVDSAGTADLSDAAGDAFTLSGNALDAMTRGQIVVLSDRPVVTDLLAALFDLATWIAARWTPEQAEAFALMHPPRPDRTYPTQEEVAAGLGITRQAMQARLKGAGWDALHPAISAVRRHDWSLPSGAAKP